MYLKTYFAEAIGSSSRASTTRTRSPASCLTWLLQTGWSFLPLRPNRAVLPGHNLARESITTPGRASQGPHYCPSPSTHGLGSSSRSPSTPCLAPGPPSKSPSLQIKVRTSTTYLKSLKTTAWLLLLTFHLLAGFKGKIKGPRWF